jgi:hypothetical protein
VSAPHRRKQLSPNISTDAGISISINPVPENDCFSIRDNFDPGSIVTDESNSHSRKQLSPKISTEPEIATDLRVVFENALASIRFKFDIFSNTRNLNCLLLEKHPEVMKLIGEGIQSLVAEKLRLPMTETHLIMLSTTIILGQNSSDISQRIGEIWDSLIKMEVTLLPVVDE